jgi:signal transduction histidine kinase
MSTTRYRYLLERVYLDMVNANALIDVHHDKGEAVVNVLEFKPFDAAFYNVGVSLPHGEPAEIAGRLVGPPAAPFDAELFPLVFEAFQRLYVQIEKVFEDFDLMVRRNEWFPAILSPELVVLVESWRDWWWKRATAPQSGRARGRGPSARDRNCWLELSRLLLALIPQPAYQGRSAGNVVYAKLTGQESPDPALRLDNDGFLKMQRAAYAWRSGGEMDSSSELRGLLELLSVMPVSPDMKGAILRKALSAPNRVLVDRALGEFSGEMAMTAIGGPMIHNGQLEGIIYAAARGARLGNSQNQSLKDLARLGAARRHQLREHIMRDVLLHAAQGERDLSPVLLVLKHIPLLFSVVGAAAVCLHQGEARQRSLPAGLIWRESTGEGQQMRFTPRLDEPRDHHLLDDVREYARWFMGFTGDRPVCSGQTVKETARLLEAFTGDKQLVGRAQTVCAFNVKVPLRREEWVYLLFFLEPQSWASGPGKDHLHLETSVPQMWLELEAALDFVFANRSAVEQTILRLVYTSAAHSLQGPASFALSFADLAATHLSSNNLEMARRSLAQAQVALKTLTYSARAVQKFIHRTASLPLALSRGSEARSLVSEEREDANMEKLEVRQIVDEYVTLFQNANPRIDLKVEIEGRPVSCMGRGELLHWVIWEMLENATRATRKIAESTVEVQQVKVAIRYRVRTISIAVENPVGPLTRAHCRVLIRNARAGQPNRSNTSGGSGMGLAYCFWMAQEMKSKFTMNVLKGRCRATLTLTLRAEV